MKPAEETLNGKVKVKNPRYMKLTEWFDYLPDAFTIWFAHKFYFFYYDYLMVEIEVDVEAWVEPRPYGSTNVLEYCSDTKETRLFISNEENYERQSISTAMMVFIFGKSKALNLCNKAIDMAFIHTNTI